MPGCHHLTGHCCISGNRASVFSIGKIQTVGKQTTGLNTTGGHRIGHIQLTIYHQIPLTIHTRSCQITMHRQVRAGPQHQVFLNRQAGSRSEIKCIHSICAHSHLPDFHLPIEQNAALCRFPESHVCTIHAGK